MSKKYSKNALISHYYKYILQITNYFILLIANILSLRCYKDEGGDHGTPSSVVRSCSNCLRSSGGQYLSISAPSTAIGILTPEIN